MSDTNERSVASAGSVAGEPVAWAALRDDGDIAWIGYTPEGAADGACGRRIVPLYRHPQPSLTDAERTLIEKLTWESEHPKMGRSIWVMPQDRETAHGLLERLK